MSEVAESHRTPEQFWRWSRNVNALGFLALNALHMHTLAGVAAIAAIGSEAMRQYRSH